MVYLFYGPNSYARNRAVRSLINERLAKYPDIIFQKFYLDEEGEDQKLHDFCLSKGLFEQGKKMALVENISSGDKELVENIISGSTKEKELIVFINESWDDKTLPKKVSSLFADEDVKKEFFEPFSLKGIIGAISKDEYFYKVPLDPKAVEELYNLLEGNDLATINEIIKLSHLQKPIDLDMIRSISDYQKGARIYDFSKKITYPSKLGEKLFYLESLLSQKFEPMSIFNYISKISNSPELVDKMADFDIKIKSGLIEPGQVITAMVL